MAQNDDKYTDPELRKEIKEDVQAGDKGGKPGQWSARKVQIVAAEYKKASHERGFSPYTTSKSEQSESQKHISQWTDEEWQTSNGSANARETKKNADGEEEETMRRYLPKAAWEKMSEEEKNETDRIKVEGGKEGKQFIPNTEAAKEARRSSRKREIADGDVSEDEGKEVENGHKGAHDRDEDSTIKDNDARGRSVEVGKGEDNETVQDDKSQNEGPVAKKRKGNSGDVHVSKERDEDPNEAVRKTHNQSNEDKSDSKQEVEHGQPGTAERLPEKGQTVHWKSSTWIEGTVVEILTSETDFKGRKAKASKEDPRIVCKSAKSGKEAVHKASAVYF